MFSPLSSTLIYGESDAVLVDPPLTIDQAKRVGDWVEASGRKLTHIFVTHGHGDHWFTGRRRRYRSSSIMAAIRSRKASLQVSIVRAENATGIINLHTELEPENTPGPEYPNQLPNLTVSERGSRVPRQNVGEHQKCGRSTSPAAEAPPLLLAVEMQV